MSADDLRDVNVGEVSAAEPCLGVEQSQQKIVVDSADKQHHATPAGRFRNPECRAAVTRTCVYGHSLLNEMKLL